MKPLRIFDKRKGMLRSNIFLHIIFQTMLMFPLALQASAWLQPKNSGVIVTNIQPSLSCKYWNKQGKLKNGPCFHQFLINPYFEYGYTSYLTIILNPNFLSYSQMREVSHFALGYINMGGRFLIFQKNNYICSLQMLLNQPFKSNKFGKQNGPSSEFALANEEYYLDVRALFGVAGVLKRNVWYANVETAFRPYFQGAASEFHIDFFIGEKIWNEKLIFEIQELNTLSAHDPANYLQPNYNVFTLVPNMVYWFKSNVAIQIGIKQDFYGNNTGRGTSPFIAFAVRI